MMNRILQLTTQSVDIVFILSATAQTPHEHDVQFIRPQAQFGAELTPAQYRLDF